jgi:hypothetical protein
VSLDPSYEKYSWKRWPELRQQQFSRHIIFNTGVPIFQDHEKFFLQNGIICRMSGACMGFYRLLKRNSFEVLLSLQSFLLCYALRRSGF